jgi:hypothetical protein
MIRWLHEFDLLDIDLQPTTSAGDCIWPVILWQSISEKHPDRSIDHFFERNHRERQGKQWQCQHDCELHDSLPADRH